MCVYIKKAYIHLKTKTDIKGVSTLRDRQGRVGSTALMSRFYVGVLFAEAVKNTFPDRQAEKA